MHLRWESGSNKCMYMFIRWCIYIYICICVCMHVYVYIYNYICVCVRAQKHTEKRKVICIFWWDFVFLLNCFYLFGAAYLSPCCVAGWFTFTPIEKSQSCACPRPMKTDAPVGSKMVAISVYDHPCLYIRAILNQPTNDHGYNWRSMFISSSTTFIFLDQNINATFW